MAGSISYFGSSAAMWSAGDGAPPARGKRPTPSFDFAADPAAEADAIARWVAEALAALQAEWTDARCGCSMLGPVSGVVPRMPEALAERGVAVGSVLGVWTVPAPVLDAGSRPSQSPWPSVRQRLKPYLMFDLWPELQAGVCAGNGADWREMALTESSVVVVKHTLPLRLAGARLAREVWGAIRSGRVRRSAVRAARVHLGRRQIGEMAAWAWPFRWAWLLGWVAILAAVVASRVVAARIIAAHLYPDGRSDTSPDGSLDTSPAARLYMGTSPRPPGASVRCAFEWRDAVLLCFANLTVAAYAARGRAPYAVAMKEAQALKVSGTVALRLKEHAVAAQQYEAGARRAGELRGEGWWWLNGRALAAADRLRAACLNNVAAAHLQQQNWVEAAAAAGGVLGVLNLDAATAAKARYRRAVARASQCDVAGAREDLLAAEKIRPGDRHVDALLRTLQFNEATKRAEGVAQGGEGSGVGGASRRGGGSTSNSGPGAESGANSGLGAESGAGSASPGTACSVPRPAAPPAVGAVNSFFPAAGSGAATIAGAATTGKGATTACAATKAGSASTLAGTAARLQRFGWAKEWFEKKLERMACTDEDGALLVVTGVHRFRGEAWIRTTPPRRARPAPGHVSGHVPCPGAVRTAHFDLSLAVEWRAIVGQQSYGGTVTLDDVCDGNEPGIAYEVRIEMEAGPEAGSGEEAALLNLIGPLAPAGVAGVEGKLGRMLWDRVMLFRHEFQKHAAEEAGELDASQDA